MLPGLLEAVLKLPGLAVASSLSGTLELPNSRRIKGRAWSYGDRFL
jgi:hypothetical protein